MRHKYILLVTALVSLMSLVSFAVVAPPAKGIWVPVEITTNPAIMSANSTMQITVRLSGTTTSNQVVDMSTSGASSYTNFPSTITVYAGNDRRTFSVTTSGTVESNTITAECNGGDAAVAVPE